MPAWREVLLRRTPAASNLPPVPRHAQLIILKYGLQYICVSTCCNSRLANIHTHFKDVREPCTTSLLQAKHTHLDILTSFIVWFQPCKTSDLHTNLTHSLQNGWRFNTFNTLPHVKLIRAQYFWKPNNPPSCTSVMHLFISWKPDLDCVSKPQSKGSREVGRVWTTICTF